MAKKTTTTPASRIRGGGAGSRNNDHRRAEHCNVALTPRNWRFPLPAGCRQPRTPYRIICRIRYAPPPENVAGEVSSAESTNREKVNIKKEEEEGGAPTMDGAAAAAAGEPPAALFDALMSEALPDFSEFDDPTFISEFFKHIPEY